MFSHVLSHFIQRHKRFQSVLDNFTLLFYVCSSNSMKSDSHLIQVLKDTGFTVCSLHQFSNIPFHFSSCAFSHYDSLQTLVLIGLNPLAVFPQLHSVLQVATCSVSCLFVGANCFVSNFTTFLKRISLSKPTKITFISILFQREISNCELFHVSFSPAVLFEGKHLL
jgi:hypothetical protein